MAATARVASVAVATTGRVRVASVSVLSTPGGANARVRVASVSIVATAPTPCRVRVASVAIIDRPLLDGTPLLVEFDVVRWSPIPGELVMFTDEGAWVPC